MAGITPSTQLSTDTAAYGAKAAGLLSLQALGFRVPPFYVLPFQAAQAVLNQDLHLDKLVKDWREQNAIDPQSRWAVRSSAGVEDGQEKSFAGLFTTRINVLPEELPQAIEEVMAAYENVKKLGYDERQSFTYGVIVQQMIRPDYSGVIFSHNPLDPADTDAYANFVPGLGENLVSGRAEAFMVTASPKGKPTFLNADQTFVGEQFDGALRPVEQTGAQMKSDLSPLLQELFAGSRKLFTAKGHPVDCEFAIADGLLYWVQVRPITSPKTEPVIRVWDNANIGENYPGLTLPLSVSFAQHTYGKGYSSMNRFLGMSKAQTERNLPLLYQMVGAIQGAMYYNVTAWQQLLYQLPFGKRTSKLITRLWNTEDAEFQPLTKSGSPLILLRLLGNLLGAFIRFPKHKAQFEASYEREIIGFDLTQLNDQSHAELVAAYQGFEERFGNNWIAPMLNGFYTLVLFSSLKKIFRNSRLFESHPNFVNDILFSQGDVISVKIVRDFQTLCQRIQQDEGLSKLFAEGTPASIWQKLSQNHPDFKSEVDTYIEAFGERASEEELKMETVNYKDDPLLFVDFLQVNSQVAIQRKTETQNFDYQAVLRKAYRYNPIKRGLLKALIRMTLPRFRDRENYRFSRTKTFGIARTIFRKIGKNLHQEGILADPQDYLYLTFQELMDPRLSPGYPALVAQRKADYVRFAEVERAPRYHETESGMQPVQHMEDVNATDTLKGVGCCSGIVRGKVTIVDGANWNELEEHGAIFVAHHFEPGWINLFAKASGVISERGNLLSHTAILCREMGIPSIVGVKGLMKRIEAGTEIQMNGATGEIQLIAAETESNT